MQAVCASDVVSFSVITVSLLHIFATLDAVFQILGQEPHCHSQPLGVFAGGSLVLSIITGHFGINVDGIPGAEESPYAFALFTSVLILLGVLLIGMGLLFLGLKKPIIEEDVDVRKLELQEFVKMLLQQAESHAQERKTVPPTNPTAAPRLPDGADYFLIS